MLRDMQSSSIVSIHAPRERSDLCGGVAQDRRGVSIHAPRERSDDVHTNKRRYEHCFNPRSP